MTMAATRTGGTAVRVALYWHVVDVLLLARGAPFDIPPGTLLPDGHTFPFADSGRECGPQYVRVSSKVVQLKLSEIQRFFGTRPLLCKGPGKVLVTSGTALREEISIMISKNAKTHMRTIGYTTQY